MFHQALWERRASYQVCTRRAGREYLLLAYLRGDVDQWRRVVAEGPPEGPLPAAARTALAEAAAALQAELDVALLACLFPSTKRNPSTERKAMEDPESGRARRAKEAVAAGPTFTMGDGGALL